MNKQISEVLLGLNVRRVEAADIPNVIEIDSISTGVEKPLYWYERFHEFGTRGGDTRFFLVAEAEAEAEAKILGFIIGEIRDWEFGTSPCGWVFGINVRPEARLHGVATRLLDVLCDNFQRAGMTKVRTLLGVDDMLVMSFYRSQGMMAAPMVTLQRELK